MLGHLVLNKAIITILLLALTAVPQTIYAQTNFKINIDSLENKITQNEGLAKLSSILLYCESNFKLHPKKTIEYTNQGISIAEIHNKTTSTIELYRLKAESMNALGNLTGCLDNINKAININIQLKDSTLFIKNQITYGNYFYAVGDYTLARDELNKAVLYSQKIQDTNSYFRSKHLITNTYVVQGEYQKALQLCNELIPFGIKNKINHTKVYLNKGIILHNIEKPSEALELFFKCKKEFLKERNELGVTTTDHHIGYLLENLGLYEESLKYYQSVYQYFSQSNIVNNLSHINLNLGEIMLKLNRFDEAENHLIKALTLKQNNGIKNLSDIYSSLGHAYLLKKDYPTAIAYFDKSMNNAKQSGLVRSEAIVYNYFSQYYYETSDFYKAEKHAQKALKTNLEIQTQRGISTAYENLYLIYEKQGKFEQALRSKNKLDSITKLTKGPVELLKITQNVILQTLKKHENLEQSAKKQKPSIYFWIIPILLILGIGIFMSKKQKPKKKKSEDTQYINVKEAEDLARKLQHVIQDQKPYTNPNLSLRDLANLISTTDKKLSTLLNQHLKTTFYDYINELRIENFLVRIKNEENKVYSIIGLATDCGFRSKSSFYRAFKKTKHVSPSQYIKENFN